MISKKKKSCFRVGIYTKSTFLKRMQFCFDKLNSPRLDKQKILWILQTALDVCFLVKRELLPTYTSFPVFPSCASKEKGFNGSVFFYVVLVFLCFPSG